MTVLQLGPYPPPNGGVQTNLVAIRRHLKRHGIKTAVINLFRFRDARDEDVYHPASAWETFRLLLRLPYRILHYHLGGNVTARLLGLSLVVCWLPGRKAVLTFHSGGYPSSPQGRKAGWWTVPGFVFRQFDRIIAVNDEIANMMRRYGVPGERIRVICPTAVDPSAIAGSLPEPLASFFQAHHPTLVSVSALEPEYDLELQIGALGQVRRAYPNAGLVIFGGGSLREKISAAIAAQPWANDILLAGDVPHSVTLFAVAQAAMMLRTTLYDGDAISVREALYLGTPVIATDNGMRPPGVRLMPVGDAAALVEAICELAEQPRREPGQEPAGLENLDAVLAVYRELAAS